MAMIFQDPDEFSRSHHASGPADCRSSRRADRASPKARALELMRLVEIDHPRQRYEQMPHHFSGGMRQRIAIAIALAGDPQILLADEPTTALDEDTQKQILKLLAKIDIATIFITHDLSLVEDIADRVAIMKDGRIVETGSVRQVFDAPGHPYTKKLLGYLDYGKGRGHDHKHKQQRFDTPLVDARTQKKAFPWTGIRFIMRWRILRWIFIKEKFWA